MRRIFIPVLIVFVLLPFSVSAETYYVDKDSIGGTCSDSNPGTITQPWCTIGKANSILQSGDTVYIRAGTYTGTNAIINPGNSGSDGYPITYTNYNDEVATITELGGGNSAVYLLSKSYITIDGLKIDGKYQYPNAVIHYWVRIRYSDAHHNIIQNCIMQYCNAWSGIRIKEYSHHNKILNNSFIYCGEPQPPAADDYGDTIELAMGAHHNLVEGNNVSYGGHDLVQIGDGPDTDYNIIRNNIFYNPWGRIMGMGENGCLRNIVEGNIFKESNHHQNDAWMANAGLQNSGSYNIIRRNVFNNNEGNGMYVFDPNIRPQNNKIYHNVFYHNGYSYKEEWRAGLGWFNWNNNADFGGDAVKNNIFYQNHEGPYEYSKCDSGDFTFANNHESGDPKFVDAGSDDFTLQETSPCIDNGTWLTATASSGSGTQIPVNDANYFTDGWGIVDGDVIQLEGQTQTFGITSVDYDNNIITVDTTLTWNSGQGVSLAYSGPAPDIGAYEYQEEANICNQADVLCVDDTPGDYQEYSTIQACANAVQAGQTCLVFEGNYNERVSVSGSGSEGNLITFQVNSGDTVTVDGGFEIYGNYIRIDGFRVTGASTCTWSSTDYNIYISGDYCEVVNCYIYEGKSAGLMTGGSSNNCIIKDSEFYQNGGLGIEIHGSYQTVENCEIHDSRCAPCNSDADGIFIYGSNHIFKGNYIHDITFANNPGYDPHIDAFQTAAEHDHYNITFEGNHIDLMEWQSQNAYGKGWECERLKNSVIKNNIVKAHVGVGVWSGSYAESLNIVNNVFVGDPDPPCSVGSDCWPTGINLEYCPNTVVKNNIVVDWLWRHIGIYGNTTSGLDMDYNCLYNTDGSTPGCTTGYCQQPNDLWKVDPKFVNFSGKDFHLQPDSPAIDAGADLSGIVTDDYEGNPRPQGNGYDMGAYEYVSGAPPPTCSDGTLYGQCSSNKPKYCDNGTLVDDCNTCGCPGGYDCQPNGSCQFSGYSGPVAWYHFDEGSGTTAGDSSGNGNDGTIHGGSTYTTGKIGSHALQFDGVTGYVDIGTEGFSSSAGTVEVWANISSFPSVDKSYVFSHYTPSPIANRIYLDLNPDGTWSTGMGNAYELVRGSTLNANTWYHLAIAWDGTYVRGYKDGDLDFGPTSYSGLSTIYNVAYLGSFNGAQEFLNGTIDEVRIYDRALTPEEIVELYNQGTGNYSEADLNNDGFVDILDLGIIAGDFGKTSGYAPRADVVDNNEIDVFDLVFVASRFT